MRKPYKHPRWLAAAVLSVSMLLTVSVTAAHAGLNPSPVAAVAEQGIQQDYPLFLKEKFGVVVPDRSTKGDYIQTVARILQLKPPAEAVAFSDLDASSPFYEAAAALRGNGILSGSEVRASGTLSAFQALFIAVKAADLSELAYSYPQSKTASSLTKLHLKADVFQSVTAAQEVAAAIDAGLVAPAYYKELKPGAPATKAFVEQLLGQVLSTKGLYEHYIGRTSDADIYAKLFDSYRTSDVIEAPELEAVVNDALEQGLVTGYNLKDSRYDPNFIDSLTITYGHSDIKHAVQLIGLLRSEGIDAKVQFEPKTSAFVHLLEWGEPSPDNDNRYKKLANGNYIASAKEYDISFEFKSAADKERFQPIVLQYAKKNSDDTKGLIAGSWWQPLYYSLTKLKDYDIITNNKITGDGPYYAQSFSLNKDSESIAAGFRKIAPEAHVSTYTFWVDRPFYNYLTGDDFK
ncbi:hypothetical protein KZ483_05050 [Paenibacillus sp. sptzw28]|uniref:hypothetical protein n=1 Tax=Paenibacillus sp. sptzw28 TaxID=715179 RepID=UPI001C6F204F|nr:hypothetical protein [Paenibacillus sp. sptzw28]QYR22356.1 hypothetical protein KZ483_05050 [Paenibacillus sp. sptzw28]